jgi:hypothetical protein
MARPTSVTDISEWLPSNRLLYSYGKSLQLLWTIGWVGLVQPTEMRKILIPVRDKATTKPLYLVSHSGNLTVAIHKLYMQ